MFKPYQLTLKPHAVNDYKRKCAFNGARVAGLYKTNTQRAVGGVCCNTHFGHSVVTLSKLVLIIPVLIKMSIKKKRGYGGGNSLLCC